MCSRFEQMGHAIRPTDFATVLLASGEAALRWGLPVSWDAKPLINARAETLDSRPTFRRMLHQRLLVPSTAWWEWHNKRRHRLDLASNRPMAFAGLFDGEHFTIITRPAHPSLSAIHDRMPATLADDCHAAWLSGDADIAALLAEPGLDYRANPDEDPPLQGILFE